MTTLLDLKNKAGFTLEHSINNALKQLKLKNPTWTLDKFFSSCQLHYGVQPTQLIAILATRDRWWEVASAELSKSRTAQAVVRSILQLVQLPQEEARSQENSDRY